MKTSGEFTLQRFEIEAPAIGEPFSIVFFGDVHRDAPLHAKDKWHEDLERLKRMKNAYFFGMGDYVDSASSSERECLGRASLHDSTRADLSSIARAKVTLLEKELSFMKGRIIGLIGGNHYFAFEDGTTTDNKLCERLGCKFLGVSSFTRLAIFKNSICINFDIWAHHGAGGARLPGGSINRVDQMREHAEADCYVMGHDHKRGVLPATPRMTLQNNARKGLVLKQRQQWLIRSGSYLKAYENGEKSYNVDAARGPSSLGYCELEITFRRPIKRGKQSVELEVRGIA